MKFKLFLTLTFFFISFTSLLAQNRVLINSIEYDVPIFNAYSYNIDYGKSYCDWWDRNIETSKRTFLQRTILSRVKSGQVKAFSDDGVILSSEDIKAVLSRPDTLTYQRIEYPFDQYDTIIMGEIYHSDIQYIRFREQWIFNVKTFKISKIITEYSPVWVEYNYKNQRTGRTKALFWIKSNHRIKNNRLLVDLIRYDISLNNATESFFNISPIYIIKDSIVLNNYFSAFLENIRDSKIKVCDYLLFENYQNLLIENFDFFNQDEANSIIYRNDSVYIAPSGLNNYTKDSIIVVKLDPADIEGLRFVESWYFDDNTLEIRKHIHGFSMFVTKTSYNYGNTSIAHQRYTGLSEIFYYSFSTPKRYFEFK